MTELAARGVPTPVASPSQQTADASAPLRSEKVSGIWTFIIVECLTFSAYFVIYMLYRMHDRETFQAGQAQLSPNFGLINTLILLTSSWLAARSLHYARSGLYGIAARQAALTVALGCAFVISKLSEWRFELSQGYSFETNDFFAFYFFLTGIHVVHVLVGFVFMGAAIRALRAAQPRSRGSHGSHAAESIEVASIYWHMVDFLWVIIFGLLYVVR